jgi:hypothetical protein
MTGTQLLVAWGVLAIAAAGLGGILASLKHRDISHWIVVSMLMPPAVLFLAFLPKYNGFPPRPREPAHSDDHWF